MDEPKKKSSVLKYIALGCVGVLVLVTATCVGLGFWAKSKLEKAGGPQAFATQMISKGGSALALPALPAEEREAAKKVLEDLQAKAKSFTKEDIQALGNAMDRLNKAYKANHTITPDDARAFITECKAIVDKH